jgi:hypothetical protein
VHTGRPRLKRPKEEAEAVMAETASASSRASSPAGSLKRTASPSPEVIIIVLLNILKINEILNAYTTAPDTHQIDFGSESAITFLINKKFQV